MDLVQRSFSGSTFRPRPQVEFEKSTQTLMIVTSWGPPEQGQTVIDLIKDQIVAAREPEATRVRNYIEGLSEEANLLRSAASYANEQIFHRENSKEYSAAVEIALITFSKKVLSWVQIGSPHLVLSTSRGFQPLAYAPDWSWQLQQTAPLVSRALGLEQNSYFNCGSCRLQGDESLLLISRSDLPSSFYLQQGPDLQSCAQALIADSEEAPFWIGVLSIS